MNDMYMLDLNSMEWTDISNTSLSDPSPTPRSGHGFASCDDDLYVFGGVGLPQQAITIIATPDATGMLTSSK